MDNLRINRQSIVFEINKLSSGIATGEYSDIMRKMIDDLENQLLELDEKVMGTEWILAAG